MINSNFKNPNIINKTYIKALSPDDHEERTGLLAQGRVAWRAGMDRPERVANPVFEMKYQSFKSIVLKDIDVNKELSSNNRPQWVHILPGPLNDNEFPGDNETIFKYWLESLFHGDQHLLIKQWSDKYGNGASNYVTPAPKFGWGHNPSISYFVIICDPNDHQRLARNHVKKAPIYDGASYGQSFLGHYDVKEWRQQRNHLMQPMMPLSIFSTMLPDFEIASKELVTSFYSGEGSTLFYGSDRPEKAYNVHELVLDTTFRVLLRTLFGETDEFIKANSQSIRWALQNPEISNIKARTIIKTWCNNIMERTQERAKIDINNRQSSEGFAKTGPLMREMLDIPAMYKCKLPGHRGAEKQVMDNIGILTLAGHDTTGATITFCLMEMCEHPEWQEKCRIEVDELFALVKKENRSIKYSDFNNLKNITKCINETLRLWNAVPYGSQRELEYDDVITGPNGTKVHLPKGTMFLIPNFCQGRSETLWGGDAAEWNPGRWSGFAESESLNFKGETIPQFSARNPESPRFHPFTRGPRDCFGKNFAQAEMRVIIAHLLHNFNFDLAEPSLSTYLQNPTQIAWQISGILKPRDGMWMHVTPRNQTAKL